MTRAIVQIPATFDSATRRKDRSVSLKFTSNQEVPTPEFAQLDALTPTTGFVMFAANSFDDADVPKDDAPGEGKTQAQRIRGLLWHCWRQNTDQSEDFDAYYRRRTNLLIEALKQELD